MRVDQSLIIVEDDSAFAQALARSFRKRGYDVHICSGLPELMDALSIITPAFVVVDLKVIGGSGLECVQLLHAKSKLTRIVVLTGFASIATAVEAIKLGAQHYLAKPANADDIEAAFQHKAGDSSISLSERSTSIKNLEWERIHEVLVETDFNVSETARRLGMHRRTLARKLEKRRVT
jgi:two-component system response regulator RegA